MAVAGRESIRRGLADPIAGRVACVRRLGRRSAYLTTIPIPRTTLFTVGRTRDGMPLLQGSRAPWSPADPPGPSSARSCAPDGSRPERDTTVLRIPRRVAAAAISGVAALAMVATAAAPASAAIGIPGEPTITLPINDSEAGGTYDQDFTRVYANTTPDGTPVYIYVPEGRRSTAPRRRASRASTPRSTTNPGDEFTPCADQDVNDYVLTQAQIDYMGDQLADQIVAVDEEHFGEMDAADPAEPASDSLVMIVYNVQDANYYDCAETTYTAGLLRPGVHRLVRHERDRDRRVRLGEPRRSGGLAVERRGRLERPADPLRGRHRPRAGAPAHELQRPRRASAGSTRASRTSRCSSTATTSAART